MSNMAIITTSDLELLRGKSHTSQTYMSVEVPETSWSGTVTTDPARFSDSIQFNSGSGDVSNILEGCEVWIGQGVNSKSRGTVRLREFNSGDGISGNIKVSANNFDFETGDIITIKLSFRLRPLFPLITGTGLTAQFFKDKDIAYNNQNTNLNPIIIAGGNRAMFMSNATINPHLENSYAVADGASIVNYQMTSYTVSGSPVTFNYNASTGIGDFTFNSAGQYWIQYRIIDSNGVEQLSYRFYRVHHATDMPLIEFGLTTITGAWGSNGYNCSIKAYDDATLLDIDDETICIIWEVANYNETEKSITLLPDNANTLISGYFRKESIDRNIAIGVGNVTFAVETINKLLENHYMFSASSEAQSSFVNTWWKFRNTLTTTRGAHNYLLWQTTLLSICDLIGVNSDMDMLRPYCSFAGGSVFSQVNGLLENTGIRHKLISDHGGSLHISPLKQLLTDPERAILPEVFELEMSDSSSQETIIRNTVASTALVRTSGFSWDGTFSAAGCTDGSSWCPTSAPHCSVSGNNPDDFGDKIVNFDRQTFRDQTHANIIAGRKFGQLNNLYPDIRLKMHGNYFNVFDPAFPYYYTKEYQQVDTIRGITITDKQSYVTNVTTTIDTKTGISVTNVVLEVEVDTLDGIFEECVSDFPSSFSPPIIDTPDPIGGCSEPIYTAGINGFSRYLCSSWLHTTTEDTKDMRADPYVWENVWRCGDGYIKRSIDSGDTWTDLTPTNPPNDAGDSPAPSSNDLIFEHMDVAWAEQGKFVFLANWDNGSENRLWIIRTLDHGQSWVWESVTVDVSTGTSPTGILETSLQSPYHGFTTNGALTNINIAHTERSPTTARLAATVTTVNAEYDTPYVTSEDQLIIPAPPAPPYYDYNYVTSSASNDFYTVLVSYRDSVDTSPLQAYLHEFTTDGNVIENSTLDVSSYLPTPLGSALGGIMAMTAMRSDMILTATCYDDPSVTFLAFTNDPIALATSYTFDLTALGFPPIDSGLGIQIIHRLTDTTGAFIYSVDESTWAVIYFTGFGATMVLESYTTVSGEYSTPFQQVNYTTQTFVPRTIPYGNNDFFLLTFEPESPVVIPPENPTSFNIYAMRVTGVSIAVRSSLNEKGYPNSTRTTKYIDGVVRTDTVANDRLFVSLGTSELIEYDVDTFQVNSNLQTTYYTERYFTTQTSTTDRTNMVRQQLLDLDYIGVVFEEARSSVSIGESLFGYYPKIAGSVKTFEDRYDYNNANGLFEYNNELYACLTGDLVLPVIYKFDGIVWEVFHEITSVHLPSIPRVTCAETSGTKAYIGIKYDASDFGRIVEVDMGTLIETHHAFNGQEPNALYKLGSDLYAGTSQNSSSGDYRHLYLLQGGTWVQQETVSNTADIYSLGEFNGVLHAGTEDNLLEWNGIGEWITVATNTAGFINAMAQLGSLLYYSVIGGELWGYNTTATLIETVPSGDIVDILTVGTEVYMTTTDYSNEENFVRFDTNNAGAGIQLAYSTFSKVSFTDMILFNDGVDDFIFYGTGDILNPSSNPFAGIHKYKIFGGSAVSYDVHGLGIALGRETSRVSYITAHDRANNKLISKTFDNDLIDTFTTTLDSGVSDANVSNRTSWAYPFSDWYYEDVCYVHGRFNSTYVIRTPDYGTTWLNVGDNFGADFVGSIYVYGNDTIQAIRNRVSGISEMYLIINGLKTYHSTIPFNRLVNAHGLGVNNTGSFVGSDTPQSYMVSKTVYPLLNYSNYTFNHETVGDIMSLEVPG